MEDKKKLFFLHHDEEQEYSRSNWVKRSETEQISKFREMAPNLSQSLLDHRHAPALQFTRSFCQSMVEILVWRGSRTGRSSKQYFGLSLTHATLGYTLLAAFAETFIGQGSTRIGTPLERIIEIMKRTEQKSERTCRAIIDDGVERGHIVKSKWSVDHRKTVLFISPNAVQEWLESGVLKNFEFLQGTGLKETLEDLDEDMLIENGELPKFTRKFLDAYEKDKACSDSE